MNRIELVMDTETGGLDETVHSLMTAAFVDPRSGAYIDLHVAENPFVVSPEALRVNRLDMLDLARNGRTPVECVGALAQFVSNCAGGQQVKEIVAVGWNVGFDYRFLKRLYIQAGQVNLFRTWTHRFLDLMGVFRFLQDIGQIKGVRGCRLDNALEYYGITMSDEHRHTALGDALATVEVFKKMKESVKEIS